MLKQEIPEKVVEFLKVSEEAHCLENFVDIDIDKRMQDVKKTCERISKHETNVIKYSARLSRS